MEQEQKGCRVDSPIPERWKIGGEVFKRCPAKMATQESWFAIQLYGHYKNGFLPVAGGILDQSVKFVQAMEIIDRVVPVSRAGA